MEPLLSCISMQLNNYSAQAIIHSYHLHMLCRRTTRYWYDWNHSITGRLQTMWAAARLFWPLAAKHILKEGQNGIPLQRPEKSEPIGPICSAWYAYRHQRSSAMCRCGYTVAGRISLLPKNLCTNSFPRYKRNTNGFWELEKRVSFHFSGQ